MSKRSLSTEDLAELAVREYRRSSGHGRSESNRATDALQYAIRVSDRFNGPGRYYGVAGIVEPDILYLDIGDFYENTVVAERGPWGNYQFSSAALCDLLV